MSPQKFRLIDQIFQHAVELEPDARAAYLAEACADDDSLRQHVEDLLRCDEEGGAAFIGQAVREAAQKIPGIDYGPIIGRQIGPYKIVREIGRGGMGAVYQAIRSDDEYVRSVAIKFIVYGMDSSDALARFRVERQVLATLQHPNIATLLDGGTTADGRPYIVMEYIEGEPLMVYCQQRKVPIPDRLNLFRSLCGAVHHAHQMLVIHRDIKPANVLVTADGVPKLLDFGIAKLLSPELALQDAPITMTEMRRLTPQYASPEHIRGEQLTTASDVYSLGVLLYELLTNRSPYQATGRSLADIQRAVCDQEPTKLSKAVAHDPKLRRQLSGDLENIVAMALRKEPDRRYGSAQQLAEDLQRYLKGQPVSAREDTIFYLAGKLVRRNKLATAAFALLAVSVVAGWTSTIREARRTEARFQDVRKLANQLLGEIPQDIRNLPGSVPVRAKLVRTALQYLHNLSQDAAGDVGLQFELARAYDRVGDVQGDPDGPNLGQYPEAIASYQRSLVLTTQVVEYQRTYQVLNSLAWLHLKIGDLSWRLGNSKAAFDSYAQALKVSDILKTEMNDPRGYNIAREAYKRIARAHTAARRLDQALESGRASITAAEKFAELQPGDKASNGLAVAKMIYGDVLGVLGRIQESRSNYEEAVQRMEASIHSEPDSERIQEDLADAYRRLGDLLGAPIYFNFGELEKAELYLRKALAIEKKMADHDPMSAQGQARYALALRRLGSVQRQTKPQESLESYEQAISISQSLLQTNQADINYQRDLANHRSPYAQALQRLGLHAAALKELEDVLVVQRKLVAQLPNRSVFHEDLFHTLLAMGDLRLSMKQPETALTNYEEGLAIAQRLRQRDQRSLYAERCIAVALRGVGDAHAALARQGGDHRAQAIKAYQDSLAIWSNWHAKGIAVPFSIYREQEVSHALKSVGR